MPLPPLQRDPEPSPNEPPHSCLRSPLDLAVWIDTGRVRTREETEALAATKLLEIKTRKGTR